MSFGYWKIFVMVYKYTAGFPLFLMWNSLVFSDYRPQCSCGKVMFSQASVILFTGRAATPPPPETATAADGTHPTGMYSCFLLVFTKIFILFKCGLHLPLGKCLQKHQFITDTLPKSKTSPHSHTKSHVHFYLLSIYLSTIGKFLLIWHFFLILVENPLFFPWFPWLEKVPWFPRSVETLIQTPKWEDKSLSSLETVRLMNSVKPTVSRFITARKRSLGQGNIFSSVCQEFRSWEGVCLSACWDTTPPLSRHPTQTRLLECNLVLANRNTSRTLIKYSISCCHLLNLNKLQVQTLADCW